MEIEKAMKHLEALRDKKEQLELTPIPTKQVEVGPMGRVKIKKREPSKQQRVMKWQRLYNRTIGRLGIRGWPIMSEDKIDHRVFWLMRKIRGYNVETLDQMKDIILSEPKQETAETEKISNPVKLEPPAMPQTGFGRNNKQISGRPKDTSTKANIQRLQQGTEIDNAVRRFLLENRISPRLFGAVRANVIRTLNAGGTLGDALDAIRKNIVGTRG